MICDFELYDTFFAAKDTVGDGKYDIVPMHCLTLSERSEYKKTHHHYVDFFSRHLLKPVDKNLTKVFVGSRANLFDVTNNPLVSIGFDGTQAHVGKFKSFYSGKRLISGMPIYDETNGNLISVVTTSNGGEYTIATFGETIAYDWVHTESDLSVKTMEKTIAYANKQFDNKQELLDYISNPDDTDGTTVHVRPNYSNIIFYESGKTNLQLRFNANFANVYHNTPKMLVKVLLLVLSASTITCTKPDKKHDLKPIIAYKNTTSSISNALDVLIDYHNKTLLTLNEAQNIQSRITRDIVNGDVVTNNLKKKLALLRQSTREHASFVSTFEPTMETKSLLVDIRDCYNKTETIIGDLWSWITVIETKVKTLYDYDKLIFEIAHKITNAANMHARQITHLVGEITDMNAGLIRRRRSIFHHPTESDVIKRMGETVQYLDGVAETVQENANRVDRVIGLTSTNKSSIKINIPSSQFAVILMILLLTIFTSKTPSFTLMLIAVIGCITYAEAGTITIENHQQLEDLVVDGPFELGSHEIEQMKRMLHVCKGGIVIDEADMKMHCVHGHKRVKRGVGDTVTEYTASVKKFLGNITENEYIKKIKDYDINIKICVVSVIVYLGVSNGYIIFSMIFSIISVILFNVDYESLDPILKMVVIACVSIVIMYKVGPSVALVFLFTVWICSSKASTDLCNNRLLNTLGGFKYQENVKAVDITRGEILMKESDCFTWKSNDTSNVTHAYTVKLALIKADIDWIETKTTPLLLNQIHFLEWYENNYSIDDSATKNADASCKMLDVSHVYHFREDRGLWRCGKWWCVEHHALCVGWTKGSECHVHERTHTEDVSLVFHTTKDVDPFQTVVHNVKVGESFVLGDATFKLESIHNYRRDTLRVICGNTTYHVANTFYWPHNVIVAQKGNKVDWDFFKRYVTFSDTTFTSNIKTLLGGVPQNTLSDVSSDIYTFKADSVSMEVTVKNVVYEMGACESVSLKKNGILMRMMTYEVIASLDLVYLTPIPCNLLITLKDNLCCSMPDQNFMLNGYKVLKLSLQCMENCNVTLKYLDSSINMGTTPPISLWSFVNSGGNIITDIIEGKENTIFSGVFSSFSFSNIISNKFVKIVVVSVLVYFVFTVNPLLAACMAVALYYTWNVATAQMLHENSEDYTGAQVIIIIFVMVASKYFNSFLLKLIRQIELSPTNPILISLRFIVVSCVAITDYMESYCFIHVMVAFFFNRVYFTWLLFYKISKLYLKIMNKFCLSTGNYFTYHVLIFDFSNLLYISVLSDVLNDNIGLWTLFSIFLCCFLKIFRVNIIGYDMTCVLHWILPKNFLHTMDIFTTDPGMLTAYRGDFVSSLDKCIQVDQSDEEQCPIHGGQSGTLVNSGLINESVKYEGHFYCGYTRDPIHSRFTIKNILIHQQIEREVREDNLKIADAITSAEEKNVVDRINELTSQNKDFIVGMQVDYNFLEYGSMIIGNKEYFRSSNMTDAVCPIIYHIRHGNTTGFAFNFQGSVFTSYHITKGFPIVLPMVGRDGRTTKIVMDAVEANETQDHVIYGKTGRLAAPVEGARYVVANPKNQQFLILRYEKVVSCGNSDKSYSFVREVMCEDLKLHQYNVFSKFGWSGLPILDMQTGIPVGVYGMMREDSMGNSSVRVSTGLGTAEMVNWAQRAKAILNTGRPTMHEIVAPTGSGKSTLFPLHLATQLIERKEFGLIIVCNPLRAVPIDLKLYLQIKIAEMGLQDKIVVHHSIGGDNSYSSTMALSRPGQVCILYITYGKYLSEYKHHHPKVLILDEIHTEHHTVLLTKEVMGKKLDKGDIKFQIVTVTATPRDVANVVDRTFDEIALMELKEKEHSNFVFVENNLYIDPNNICKGTKALVFCSSKKICENSATELRRKLRGVTVVTYYSEHKDGMSSINKFNSNDTVVMLSTNAIESGITLIGCNVVYDTRMELVEELYLSETRLVKRVIDKKSYMQRRGRAGRTSNGGKYYYPANSSSLVNKHDISNITKYDKACAAIFQDLRHDDLEDETNETIAEILRMWKDYHPIKDLAQLLAYSAVNPITLRAMCEYDKNLQKYKIASQYYEIAFKKIQESEKLPFSAISAVFDIDPELPVNEFLHYRLQNSELNSMVENVVTGGVLVATVCVGIEVLSAVNGLSYCDEIYISFNNDWKVFMAHTYGDFFFAYHLEHVVNSKLDCIDEHKEHEVYLLNRLPVMAKNVIEQPQIGRVMIVAEKGILAFRLVVDNSGLINRVADDVIALWDQKPIDISETIYNMGSLNGFFMGLVEVNSAVVSYPVVDEINKWLVSCAGSLGVAATSIMPLPFWTSICTSALFDKMVQHLGASGALAVTIVASGLLVTPSIVLPVALTSLITYGVKRMLLGGPIDALGTQIPAYPVALLVGTLGGAAINHMINTNTYHPTIYGTVTGNHIDINIGNGSIVIVVKHIVLLANKINDLINSNKEVDYASLTVNFLALAAEVSTLSVHQILIVIVAASIVAVIITACRNNSHYIHTLLSTVIKDVNKVNELMDSYNKNPEDLVMVGLVIACYIVSPTSILSTVLITTNEFIKQWLNHENFDVKKAVYKGMLDGAGVPVWMTCFQVLGDLMLRWKASVGVAGGQTNSMIAISGGVISSISGLVYLIKNKDCLDITVNAFSTAGNLIKKWAAAVWAIIRKLISYVINLFSTEEVVDPYSLIQDIDGFDILAPVSAEKSKRIGHLIYIDEQYLDAIINDLKPIMHISTDKILDFIQNKISQLPESCVFEEPVLICQHDGVKQLDMCALQTWVKTLNPDGQVQLIRKVAGLCKDPLFCYSTQITDDGLTIYIYGKHEATRVDFILIIHIVGNIILMQVQSLVIVNSIIMNKVRENVFCEGTKLVAEITGSQVEKRGVSRDGLMMNLQWVRNMKFASKDNRKSNNVLSLVSSNITSMWKDKKTAVDKSYNALKLEIDSCKGKKNMQVRYCTDGIETTMTLMNNLMENTTFITVEDIHEIMCQHSTLVNGESFSIVYLDPDCRTCITKWGVDKGANVGSHELAEIPNICWFADAYRLGKETTSNSFVNQLLEANSSKLEEVAKYIHDVLDKLKKNYTFDGFCNLIINPVVIATCTPASADRTMSEFIGARLLDDKKRNHKKFENTLATLVKNSRHLDNFETVENYVILQLRYIKRTIVREHLRLASTGVNTEENSLFNNAKLQLNSRHGDLFLSGIFRSWRVENREVAHLEGKILNLMTSENTSDGTTYSFVEGQPHLVTFKPCLRDETSTEYTIAELHMDMSLLKTNSNNTNGIHVRHALPGLEDDDNYYVLSDADKFFNSLHSYRVIDGQVCIGNPRRNCNVYLNIESGHDIINDLESCHIYSNKKINVDKTCYLGDINDSSVNYDIVISDIANIPQNICMNSNAVGYVIFTTKQIPAVVQFGNRCKHVGFFAPNCISNDYDQFVMYFKYPVTQEVRNINTTLLNFLKEVILFRNKCVASKIRKLPSHHYPLRAKDKNMWMPLTHGRLINRKKGDMDLDAWAFGQHKSKPLFHVPEHIFKNRHNTLLPKMISKLKIKELNKDAIQGEFAHQRVLMAYTKSDRLQQDRTMLNHTISTLATRILEWHPLNSVVVQCSKDKAKVFEAIQTRLDQPVAHIHDEVMTELYECAAAMRSTEETKLRPYTYEEALALINKQGAAGIFENVSNMNDRLNRTDTREKVMELIMKLKNGQDCFEAVASCHHKVESKVGKHSVDGVIHTVDLDLYHPPPRLITYFDTIWRIVDWMVFGPYVNQHMKKNKMYYGSTSGTPIFEVGDYLKQWWDNYEKVAAATGDASKWDHSLGVQLMGLECQWVKSHYDPEWWPLIETVYEHVIWPIVFNRLGFAMTVTGHRLSGWILTWHNGFINSLLHARAWKKVLKMPMDTPMEELYQHVWTGCDGDDNVHIGKADVVTEANMKKIEYYMNQCNIKIRSGNHSGYRVHNKLETVDYLSHTFAPVKVGDREKWLPVRPLTEIIGKMCYTIKQAATGNQIKKSTEGKIYPIRPQDVISSPKSLSELTKAEVKDSSSEGILIETSKTLSYLLLYPHIPIIRIMCLTILAILGCPGDIKYMNNYRFKTKFGKVKIIPGHGIKTVQHAIQSVYGCNLDEIGFWNMDDYCTSLRKHYQNVITGFRAFPDHCKKLQMEKIFSWIKLSDRAFKLKHNTMAMSFRCMKEGFKMLNTNGIEAYPFPEYFALTRSTKRMWNRSFHAWTMPLFDTVDEIGEEVKKTPLYDESKIISKVESMFQYIVEKIKKAYDGSKSRIQKNSIQEAAIWMLFSTVSLISTLIIVRDRLVINKFKNRINNYRYNLFLLLVLISFINIIIVDYKFFIKLTLSLPITIFVIAGIGRVLAKDSYIFRIMHRIDNIINSILELNI